METLEQRALRIAKECFKTISPADAQIAEFARRLMAELEAWQELSDHVTISPTGIYPGRYTDPAVQRVAQWIKDTEAKLEAVNDNCTSWQRNAEVWQLKYEAERKALEEESKDFVRVITIWEQRAKQAESRLAAVFELLKAAQCPNCDGSGGYLREGPHHEAIVEQCQWCFERNALAPEESAAPQGKSERPVSDSPAPASAADLPPDSEIMVLARAIFGDNIPEAEQVLSFARMMRQR